MMFVCVCVCVCVCVVYEFVIALWISLTVIPINASCLFFLLISPLSRDGETFPVKI